MKAQNWERGRPARISVNYNNALESSQGWS